MSEAITKDRVLEALKRVKGPRLEANIVDLDLVSEIVIQTGKVYFSIEIDPSRAADLEPLRQAAEKVVGALSGVEQVVVTLTAERGKSAPPGNGAAAGRSSPMAASAPRPAAASSPPPAGEHHPRARPNTGAPPRVQMSGVPGVRAIVAVASGKGGVGKSTTAVNLALAFQVNGLRVGVLDADIYGPSMPRLLGITGRPQATDGKVLQPMQGHGLKVMSMGFLVEEDTPMIWRGPMVMSAITQMLKEVAWGELDILVVDMPPGTGDAQLTLAQQVPLAGAIIVSTPQDLALIDARKGLNMFRKVDVPVLGIVENMSTFICPRCGEQTDIFGHGGAKAEAAKLGIPFLGEVPLHLEIRETSDAGNPIVASAPGSRHAQAYRDIAAKAWAELERNRAKPTRQAPKIVMEG